VPSTLLKGALCYYFVSDVFYDTLTALLEGQRFSKVHFVPSTLAQATCLMSEKKREGYAFLLDIGFLTTSISVIYGDGIVHEESFDCGVGTIRVALMQELGVEYAVAEEMLSDANISGGFNVKDRMWTAETLNRQFPVQQINDIIKYHLDFMCERIDGFFGKYYKDKVSSGLTANPISVTGEGVNGIKGVAEHVSRRLNRLTEIVCHDQPYFEKPDRKRKKSRSDGKCN
jgi:cell division ATPase FtsA